MTSYDFEQTIDPHQLICDIITYKRRREQTLSLQGLCNILSKRKYIAAYEQALKLFTYDMRSLKHYKCLMIEKNVYPNKEI